jgi:hypothetical protein
LHSQALHSTVWLAGMAPTLNSSEQKGVLPSTEPAEPPIEVDETVEAREALDELLPPSAVEPANLPVSVHAGQTRSQTYVKHDLVTGKGAYAVSMCCHNKQSGRIRGTGVQRPLQHDPCLPLSSRLLPCVSQLNASLGDPSRVARSELVREQS